MRRSLALGASLLLMLSFAVPVTAAPGTTDLMGEQWRVYNRVFTPSLWDINKLRAGTFPVQQSVSTTTGSFAVYLLNNYNVDLTGKTLRSDVSWTSSTSYVTRSDCSGAFVRFEFQDVTAGPYDSNDYWWSTGPVALDLNTGSDGTLTISLNDRANWLNQSGKLATDTTTNWTQWQGDIVAMSPYDGFTKAMQQVKQLGLSFGSSCRYASGIAIAGRTGIFTTTSFSVVSP